MIVVYIVMGLLTFFVASFVVARYCCLENPTDADMFFLLVALALMWPIIVPLFAVGFFLFGIAKIAEKLAGGGK